MSEPTFEKKPADFELTAIIDSFEDKEAVLLTSDGQKISWPIAKLPEDCLKGTAVRLRLSSTSSDLLEKELIAKAILNEVLKNVSPKE